MAQLLIHFKLTLLGHTLRGGERTFVELGALVGALAAGWMWLVAAGVSSSPRATFDVLAIALATWAIAWIFVSMAAGGDPLKPEFFRMVPLPVRRLAAGLIAASFVGVLPAVSALAFAALVAAAAIVGGAPTALVGVAAVVLTMTVVVLLARVAAVAGGQVAGSRIGLEIAGFSQGLLISLIWIWIPIAAISATQGATAGPSMATLLTTAARAAPTGWGVIAIEAAARQDWSAAAVVLGAMAALALTLGIAWVWLLGRRLSGTASEGHGPRKTDVDASRPGLLWRLPPTPLGATVAKELRAWQRQPRRAVEIRSAIWTAVIITILPAAFGVTALLPLAGLTLLLIAAVTASNVYGMDGSAVWLTVTAPGTEDADVRGRQLAWLLLFGLLATASTFGLTALSGAEWAWPWVLATLPALAGASVGLIPWIALLMPGPLPERREVDPLDPGDDPRTTSALITQGVVMTFLPLALAVPAVLVVALGATSGLSGAVWLGVPAGIATGLVYAWFFGRLAARRLEAHGPELLERMRSRPPQAPTAAERAAARARAIPAASWVALLIGSLLLFAQAVVPLLILASGSQTRLWFVALYLPPPLQAPAIGIAAVGGILAYFVGWRMAADRQRRER